MQARKLINEIKYPKLHGKVCRALPYDKEILRNQPPKSNIFVKGFGSHWSHKELAEHFARFGQIVSARVSIRSDYESRGYGFVCFVQAQSATTACQEMDGKEIRMDSGQSFRLQVKDFVTKSERVPKDDLLFNNLFVKNFPSQDFGEPGLRRLFEPFGELMSVKVDDSNQFGFVAFRQSADAQAALAHFSKEEGGLRVVKCMKKEQRA